MALVAGILVIISMGVLTYKGATAEEGVEAGSEVVEAWITEGDMEANLAEGATPEQLQLGGELVAESGCLNCHTYRGAGSPNLGAPDLTQIGAEDRGVDCFSRYVGEPGRVRQHRHAGLPVARRGEPERHRRLPRRLEEPVGSSEPVHVFLGITGASGAPYAARLLERLAAADATVGVTASNAGIEVLATELYGDASLPRDEVLARLVEPLGADVSVYDPVDWKAPYASGSARVDAYVVCPCSMSTLASVAAGAMANLVHRAASVALKEERKLVLVPRETPLSAIHLENMLRVRNAGATIVFAAPGFYHGPESIDDLVDFVVARILDQIGVEHAAAKRWGQ